ncbi:MAG: coproporphyrinogen III oxidase [Akkermansiaceae bacterium]
MSFQSDQSLNLVRRLQSHFVQGLEQVASDTGEPITFQKAEWQRDEGKHGGGDRYYTAGNDVFNRAAVNVSHIHYDDLADKALASATAISTIIHPNNPHAPSVHMHISWTEMKNGKGYWRIMADLNPSIPYAEDTKAFEKALMDTAPDVYQEATTQGEKYFFIPALGRHRGVAHFYLEGYNTHDFDHDATLAHAIGEKVIDRYLAILGSALSNRQEVSVSDQEQQLAYHTLYLFQVLTLDRGTTSGLLVHDQNDLGIMGSLPLRVDKLLLVSWREKMKAPQNALLDSLVGCLPESGEVDDDTRQNLARAVRMHYREHPEALKLQASGNVIPPTVQNHH